MPRSFGTGSDAQFGQGGEMGDGEGDLFVQVMAVNNCHLILSSISALEAAPVIVCMFVGKST